MKNYYQILEVPKSASEIEIKRAFRLKAIKYHPDKHFGDTYFASKFIEVREAYEVLSDEGRRKTYDAEYNSFYPPSNKETITKENQKKATEEAAEEQFFYDPYKPFYSYQDRNSHQTPEFSPRINHWGEGISENADFFIFPKNIGKIVSGYTTLTKEIKEPSGFFGKMFTRYKYTCSYMGVNGFAQYTCRKNRSNITDGYEINFKNVTDLIYITQVRNQNFSYFNTAYLFEWTNKEALVKKFSGVHYDKSGNPKRNEAIEFWTNKFAERYWTLYLLDNMEKELGTKGYIQFRLAKGDNDFSMIPYINLGVGFIEFLSDKGNTKYNFNEIKKVYIKGTNLFIEHKNYEKKFLLFSSGNKNGVPLLNLSNREFFFKALELLLGYQFN